MRSIVVLALFLFAAESASAQRIKDLARVEGIRPLPLKGVGLVVGLAGTGDSQRCETTWKLYRAYLENLGMDLTDLEIRSRNVAIVTVEAKAASWTQLGSQIEVTVSSYGDAKSLKGGRLLETHLYRTPRNAKDDPLKEPIALAQGGVQLLPDTLTVGASKGTLERDISFPIHDLERAGFKIILNRPDFSTSSNIAKAINSAPFLRFVAKEELPLAHADDLGSVRVRVPKRYRNPKLVIDFISRIMTDVPVDEIDPDARVVIDHESGGVSINGNVRVKPVVVLFKNLEIRIGTDDPGAGGGRRSQPLIRVLDGLKQNGLDAKDLPAVIELIHESGALTGKLVER